MRLPERPAQPRCPLGWLRSATGDHEMESMRARAWHEHGIASLAIQDITDPWLRQALINEATRRWGPRNGGHHGR